MDEAAKQEELERQELAHARSKLTDEQRAYLDRLCQVRLKDEYCYEPKYEIALAHVLYDDRAPLQQKRDIDQVIARADRETRDREATERARNEEIEKLKREELQKQESQKREAKEAARREPLPNTVQRFNAILAESKAPQVRANEAGLERLAERAPYRPDYARFDGLQASSRGEISDAKAERLNRMFKEPLSEKGFDPTDTPTNTRSGGRGGR